MDGLATDFVPIGALAGAASWPSATVLGGFVWRHFRVGLFNSCSGLAQRLLLDQISSHECLDDVLGRCLLDQASRDQHARSLGNGGLLGFSAV